MSTSLTFSTSRLHPNGIPNDVSLLILGKCDAASILAIRGVNRHFHDLVDQNERHLVGGIIRDRYALESDLFDRMDKQVDAWRSPSNLQDSKEMELAERPTFSRLSFEYLWIVEARNRNFFLKLVEAVEEMGMLKSQAYEMAVTVTELNILCKWAYEENIFTILASWSASKIRKAEEHLNELAERGKSLNPEVRSPHSRLN
jgi:F-box domain